METKPFVSIIIPVYNDPQGLARCIDVLGKQTYPRDRFELLVVDNGSTDATREVATHPGVTLLQELDVQSSYAARNTGIRHAKGEILAFTDADCLPVPDWLSQGVMAIVGQQADLASGNVRFVYSSKRSGAEIWDSITNMQIEENIAQRNVSKTANLFVRRELFEELGLFPQNLKSGGDVIWTSKATSKGKKLVYQSAAEVAHPARGFIKLLTKQLRVGTGHVSIWAENGESTSQIFCRILTAFTPFRPLTVKRHALRKKLELERGDLLDVWFAALCCRFAGGFGNLWGFLKLNLRQIGIG